MFKKLAELFWLFARIGGLTFGGGYAMLPLLQAELVDRRHYVTEDELADYYAIGQCTPGIIAVNTATFVGYKLYGVAGGIVATLGVAFPSLIIITIIAACLQNFADYPLVQAAFSGIRACVCALILSAVLKLMKKSVVGALTWAVFGVCFVLSAVFSASPILCVLGAGVLGVGLYAMDRKKGGKAQ